MLKQTEMVKVAACECELEAMRNKHDEKIK